MTDTAPAAVVLAAGAGTRLRPLTDLLPKALCPVGDRALVDHALARAATLGPLSGVSVNVHAHREAMERHLAGRVHLSVEQPEALGTAGALGALRDWLDGRDVLVVNSDAWQRDGVAVLAAGWDRERVRLLVVEDGDRADFGGRWRYAGAALMPWSAVRGLRPEPSGLYEASWRALEQQGRLELVVADGPFVDCGTPADYLLANLLWSGGAPVVGAGAVVLGEVVRSVVWPGGYVGPHERLVEVIRAGRDVTVSGRAG